MVHGLLIFDMDGVLVDVSDSYRKAIRETVHHFTGNLVPVETIQEFKMQVGWNDDWALSQRLIRDAGKEVPYEQIVRHFQLVFRGETGYSGLIQRERWIADRGLFERLARSYQLTIFTGRLREEAEVTLQRFAPGVFHPIVATDDVQHGKPHPEGLFKIREQVPHNRVFYIGDTADDARSAEQAGVPFIGIVGPETPERQVSISSLTSRGAIAVLESIHELESTLERL